MHGLKLFPAAFVALLAVAVSEGCKKKKDGSGAIPNAATGTALPNGPPVGKNNSQVPSAVCTDVQNGTVLCVCVEGGFQARDGRVWDYDCCIGPLEVYITCGDAATCDPAAMQCYDL